MPTEHYFAYGSNLSLRQMGRRCPSARTHGRAVLEDHRLEFVQPHDAWGGGVAGIVPDASARVPGVIYALSIEDLVRLDGFEPVGERGYARVRVTVRLEAGEGFPCWTYVGKVFPEAPYPPSPAYRDVMVEGAREHALPEQHLRWLESLHTC